MATLGIIDPICVRGHAPVGGIGAQEPLVEAASQSYTKGMLVYLASGKVTEVAAGLITAAFAGFAREDATGVTNTRAPLEAITPGQRWKMTLYHSTAASAISAITQLGARFGLKVVSDKLVVDLETAEAALEDATTVNAWCRIVGFDHTYDDLGVDVYARAIVEIGSYSVADDGAPSAHWFQLAAG